MERRTRRTISLSDVQPALDFEETPPAVFTFPEYQKELLGDRLRAGLADFGVILAVYGVFMTVTLAEIGGFAALDKRIAGIYGAGFVILAAVYFVLYMLSAGQTPGMKYFRLTVVDASGEEMSPSQALMRGFGYLISIVPLSLGFIWAALDPEHLTWADKVSGTFVRRV